MGTGIGFRRSQPAYYHIDVQGDLDARWLRDYIELRVEPVTDLSARAVTRLSGELTDQAALMGVLHLLSDLDVPLLSLECFPYSQA